VNESRKRSGVLWLSLLVGLSAVIIGLVISNVFQGIWRNLILLNDRLK
jgi:hypothetical protein